MQAHRDDRVYLDGAYRGQVNGEIQHTYNGLARYEELSDPKYTDTGGTLELKEAICDRHAHDFGTEYRPEECIVSVGGKHVVFNLVQALVNPGDEVVIPAPYWVTYRDVVNYAGGRCVFVSSSEADGFSILYLDMTVDVRILVDRDTFMQRRLDRLRTELQRLGAERRTMGDRWYWILKKD